MKNNSFKHSSKVYLNAEDTEYYAQEYKKIKIFDILREKSPRLGARLLDSSLITASSLDLYDLKVVQCGKYYQVYKYSIKNSKKKLKNLKKDKDTFIYWEDLRKSSIEKICVDKLKEIELKNLNRSKFALQRLVKTNEEEFKTFITLTFETNLENISIANLKFKYWRDYIRRKFKDFKYVMVPEFQKRGAVHYHLLTNIPYDSDLLEEEIKLWQPKAKKWQIGKPLKSWSYGYSLVINMKNIKVVGYLTKYMTKEIDNRLFGFRKYTYSYNLKRPCEVFLNSFNIKDYSKLFTIEKLYDLKYSSIYFDKENNPIYYYEYCY